MVMPVVVTMVVAVVFTLRNYLPEETARSLPQEGARTEQKQTSQTDPLHRAHFVVLAKHEDSVSHTGEEHIDRQSESYTDRYNQRTKVERGTTAMECRKHTKRGDVRGRSRQQECDTCTGGDIRRQKHRDQGRGSRGTDVDRQAKQCKDDDFNSTRQGLEPLSLETRLDSGGNHKAYQDPGCCVVHHLD
jgi:hypothetical protein